MPIYRALALCLMLTACGGTLPLLPGRQITDLSLRLGAVRLTAPKGYCFGPAASRPVQGFALLVRCDRLTKRAPTSGTDAMLTAQLGKAGSATVAADPDAFADFLTSDAGRALLSASGDAGTISNLSARVADSGAVYARFDDSAADVADAGQHLVRGFVDVDGRLLVVSARGNGGVELPADTGEAVLALLLAPIFTTGQAE